MRRKAVALSLETTVTWLLIALAMLAIAAGIYYFIKLLLTRGMPG